MLTPAQRRYADKLKRPEWRLRALEALEAANYTCARCGRSGCPLEVNHKRYANDGREPWEYALDDLEALCPRCHEDHHFQLDMGRSGASTELAREVVAMFAGRLSLPKPSRPAGFDAAFIHAWVKRNVESGPPQRAVMRFAHWLWNTGTQDSEMILSLVREGLRVNPDSWYAYFAPDGPTRQCRTDQNAIAQGEAESEAHKAAERAFLKVSERRGK